jgi:nucleoside 2-deoxyribosyltransferase
MLIYLAGALFNAGERLHNLYLEKYLTELGHEVILPQRRAFKFFNGKTFDTKAIVADCIRFCGDKEVIYVGCIDGPDADSGTSIEYAFAIAKTGRAIVYRTDFRTAIEYELGINAMFDAPWTIPIFHPCYFTELREVEDYYRKLAKGIHQVILVIPKTE